MTKETIHHMTPDELLGDYNYAVVRFDCDGSPLVSNMFALESTATEYADDLNAVTTDPDREYSVVRILHPNDDEPMSQIVRELDETRTSLEDLILSVDITIEHIVKQCERLCDNNVGKRFSNMVSRSQLMSYECDRAAYTELANALAFLRGATHHMSDIEVPDVPTFPSPKI